MPHMYILECADGSYYTGSTWDLERRLWQHQNGEGANHTRKRLPVKLIYCEEYDRVDEAFYREKQVQGWSRRKKQALIEGSPEKLIEFSRNYTQYGKTSASTTRLSSPKSGSASVVSDVPSPELVYDEPSRIVEGRGGLTEESRLNALIQEKLAKIEMQDA